MSPYRTETYWTLMVLALAAMIVDRCDLEIRRRRH